MKTGNKNEIVRSFKVFEPQRRDSDPKKWQCGPLAALKLKIWDQDVRFWEENVKIRIPGKTKQEPEDTDQR